MFDKKQKITMIVSSLIVCVMILFFVGLTVKTSAIQYEINDLNKQIQDKQRSIQNLEAKIKASSSIDSLQQRAFEIGLIYPEYGDIVYLSTADKTYDELAVALIESIYE